MQKNRVSMESESIPNRCTQSSQRTQLL